MVMKIIKVDVSQLSPPEPMTVILTALETLQKQECLQVKHRRQPFPLYEKLPLAGFAYHCQVHAPDDITLFIYHFSAQQAFSDFISTN